MHYEAPGVDKPNFTCPHCHVLTSHGRTDHGYYSGQLTAADPDVVVVLRKCDACQGLSVWRRGRMIDPLATTAPPANPDMPDSVRRCYDEAAKVSALSPRSAAALLRLGVQQLCIERGEKGKNINDDIKSLVQKGLSPLVQQSLDSVRVIGNNAVHPGQIDVDDPNVVSVLFGLLNVIVEQLISTPKHIQSVYDSLPQSDRDNIAKRDGAAPKQNTAP